MVCGMEPKSENEVAKYRSLCDIWIITEIQNIKLEISATFRGSRFKQPYYMF